MTTNKKELIIMLRLTSLTEFVEEQMTKFEIPHTEKNLNKIRIKCTRVLKELDIWQNAKIELRGRNQTKVFTDQELQLLYTKIELYLLKFSDINIEELQAYRRQYEQYLEELHNMTQDDYMKQQEEAQYQPPTVTRSEAMEVMITALFEKFFEPIDVKQWNDDKAFAFFTDNIDADSVDYFLVSKRLSDPVSAYVRPRNNKTEPPLM
ncbi:hypothetical protein [Streptococcus suis]|nr:hypothetical protein [Streptococcus suis]MDG4511131.1 hypothetical protein [Streptococcus suis]HEL1593703.1 hypothetical protein [Streptococcus suis]